MRLLSTDAPERPTGRAFLEVVGVSKRFGGIQAVDNVSLTVEKGSVTALIGPNGAGKSTLFDLVTRRLQPDEGDILLQGETLMGRSMSELPRAGVARAFQTPRVFSRLTVLENVLIAYREACGVHLWEAVARPRAWRRERRQLEEQARDVLRMVNLEPLALDLAGTLSGGQKKLLELASALAAEPQILILDEPMAGVNPALGAELMSHILQQRDTAGLTVLFVEHDLATVMSVSNTVYVMAEGKLLAHGSPQEVRAHPGVIDAYLGRV